MARVLIVDDEPDILMLVRLQLTQAGHEPMAANSGEEALRLAQTVSGLDLAIVDVRMPGMDGYEVVRRLRAAGFEDLPVIFLSAKAMFEDVEEGAAFGARYITKPFRREQLLEAVADLAA